MTRCDFRSERECSCSPSECRAAAPTLAASVMVPSWKTHLAVCLFGGFIVGAVVFVVAARAEPYQKNIDLDRQEMTYVYSR